MHDYLSVNGAPTLSGEFFNADLQEATSLLSILDKDAHPSDAYTLLVYRLAAELQSETLLARLEMPQAVLHPSFHPGIFSYVVRVPSNIGHVTMNMSPYDKQSSILVNSETVADHEVAMDLAIGTNAVDIQVISPWLQQMRAYEITIKREPERIREARYPYLGEIMVWYICIHICV